MLRNYFKIAWRNLWKNKFYTALNILGLSFGVACSILLFQFITYHFSFDTYHTKAKHLYRVVTDLQLEHIEYNSGSPLSMADELKKEVAQVENAAVMLNKHSYTVAIPDKNGTGYTRYQEHENIALADKHWFELFDYTWEAGSSDEALSAPNTIVLTRMQAEKYFGKGDPIGKIIQLDDKHEVKVTGVIEDYPGNTDYQIDMFLSLSSLRSIHPDIAETMYSNWFWVNSTTSTYVLLPDASAKEKVEQTISQIKQKYLGKDAKYFHYHLQPLEQVHFDVKYGGSMQKTLLWTLGLTAIFLVIIACVNFINLATAQNLKRAKEIGTRKVLGSSPFQVFWQFMAEATCVTGTAVALSLFWIALFLPVLNQWLQLDPGLSVFAGPGILLFIGFLLVAVILMSGFYPAIILSRTKPLVALKSTVAGNHGNMLSRKSLIIVQNVMAQALIICAIVVGMQVRYLKNVDLGFSREAIVMIPTPDQDKNKSNYLYDQLLADPGIERVSFCFRAPSADKNSSGSVKYGNRPDWETFSARSVLGDSHYLETFDISLIAGRNLLESDTVKEFLINEQFVRKLGIKDPREVLGQQLIAGEFSDQRGTIVGVVKDFNTSSLYSPIEPSLITTLQSSYSSAAIKLTGKQVPRTLEQINQIWESVYTRNVFEYHFLDDQIAELYRKEDVLNKLIKTSTVIAIVISCLGLLGLSSLLTLQRTKEIGIRKVLGASITSVVTLLSKDFIKLIAIAILIAVPISWYVIDKWLEDFAYQIEIQWWMFALAGLLAVMIALLAISFQSVKAALMDPVKSLRSE